MTAAPTDAQPSLNHGWTAAAAVSDDGGTTFSVGTSHWAVYTGTAIVAVAHASASGRELVEGNDYVFGPSLDGCVATAGVICTGVVTIARVERPTRRS